MNPSAQPPLPASVEALLAERAPSIPGARTRLIEVLRAWDLQALDIVSGGYDSLVLRVETDGASAVLKLPSLAGAVTAEVAALRWWGEDAAPRVLRHDEQLGALLMELLVPGAPLRWGSAADTESVLPLLHRMQRRDADQTLPLPRLSDLSDEMLAAMREDAAQKRALVDEESARLAEAVLGELFASGDSHRQIVLHGDAVPANVLGTHDGLRIIDPRACIGEAAYDAAYWSVFSGYGQDGRRNVSLLASELGLDEERVLRWAWALAVNRLLQIADSPYPGHARLCETLREFIAVGRVGLRAA